MAAAYRSEQRRLLSFLRMTDAMMCDTLQTILVQSVTDMLEALEPASYSNAPADQRLLDGEGEWPASSSSSGGRSLQAMASMLNGSRRQRAAAAVACMQLSPVAARQQQPAEAAAAGAGAAAGPRPPLLELHVLMSSGCEELSFAPEPEQFQVGHRTAGVSYYSANRPCVSITLYCFVQVLAVERPHHQLLTCIAWLLVLLPYRAS